MPVDLPGFYFDEERNRYFPLSSKPKPSRADTIVPQQTTADGRASNDASGTILSLKRKRDKSRWNLTQFSRSTIDEMRRKRAMHEILGSNYTSLSRTDQITCSPRMGLIKCFAATIFEDELHYFVGDSRGWLWTKSSHSMRELCLERDSEIKSISISGSKVAATSFGPRPRIAIEDLDYAGRTTLLSLRSIHDVWSTHLQDDRLAVGSHRGAVILSNIDASLSMRQFKTNSDVLSIFQRDTLVYAGCRDGGMHRFDLRIPDDGKAPRYTTLYRPRNQAPKSIVHLESIGEHQMLVSTLGNEIMNFDLRYIKGDRSVVRYEGHRSAFIHNLGIAMDPDQEFLFAAGDDNRIRGWSVHTGRPLSPRTLNSAESSFIFRSTDTPLCNANVGGHAQTQQTHFLSTVFPDTVSTMQIVEDLGWGSKLYYDHGRTQGTCLWAGCEKTLYRFSLGQG